MASLSRTPERALQVRALDRRGEANGYEATRVALALELGFPLRDLRCLTPSFDISQVLVRAEAIVLNLKYVRAVLTAEHVLLMDGEHELEEEVRARIRTPFPVRDEPFELLALEGILHYMLERLQGEIDLLEPAVYSLLASLESDLAGDPTEEELRALLGFSKQLGSFAYDVGELKESLDRLLQSEEDMAAMYLTDTRDGVGGRVENHQEVEILLENYTRRLEETRNGVLELQGYIAATEAYLKIRYDGQRNKIMRQTLMLSLATFSMGCGTAVSSVFGMNLLSSLEGHPHMFWWVAGGIATSSASVFALLLSQARKDRTLFK